ncbi:MAG: YkvA family protein [Fusobacteriaceae bacterium]
MNLNDKTKKLFKAFERANIEPKEIEKAKTTASVLGDIADEFMLIVSMVEDAIKGEYKISLVNLSVFIGAIIYVINPVDVIPDVIPVIGWIDDAAVVTFIIKQHSAILDNYKEFISKRKITEV